MSLGNVVRVKLFKDEVDASGVSFEVVSQRSPYNIWNGVGLRVQCAFFAADKVTLLDPSEITSITHVVRQAANSYMLQVVAGPFPTITAAQWAAGTHQHVEFAFSDVDTSLTPGAYSVVVFGNVSDALAAVDFCCKRSLTVLDSGIPTSFTAPASSDTFLAALKTYMDARLGDYVKKVMGPGEMITLQSDRGGWRRQIGVTWDDALGPQKFDNLEKS